MADLQAQIEELWEHRAEIEPGDKQARALVREAVDLLDTGQARVAEVVGRPGRRPRVAEAAPSCCCSGSRR